MDKYFETKYFLEYVVPFAFIGIYILISCIQVYKEYRIDKFMKKQGYVLKEKDYSLAWYDGDTFIEFQKQLYKKNIKDTKTKYKKRLSKEK